MPAVPASFAVSSAMAKRAGEFAGRQGSTIADALFSAFDRHFAQYGFAVLGADGVA